MFATSQRNKRYRILVVDDEPVSRQTLTRLLQFAGYTCAAASNGAHALELARVYHPHLIVMDLMMPGMDGFEATRALKRDDSTQSIPIVTLTASSTPDDRAEAARAGAEVFLCKPLVMNELLLALHRHLPKAASPLYRGEKMTEGSADAPLSRGTKQPQLLVPLSASANRSAMTR